MPLVWSFYLKWKACKTQLFSLMVPHSHSNLNDCTWCKVGGRETQGKLISDAEKMLMDFFVSRYHLLISPLTPDDSHPCCLAKSERHLLHRALTCITRKPGSRHITSTCLPTAALQAVCVSLSTSHGEGFGPFALGRDRQTPSTSPIIGRWVLRSLPRQTCLCALSLPAGNFH